MLVAGIARTREQTVPLGLCAVMILSALGGCWWPQWINPDWIKTISPAIFTTVGDAGAERSDPARPRPRGDGAAGRRACSRTARLTLALGLRLFRLRHSATRVHVVGRSARTNA
jgi:hypothetical protein